MVNNTKSRATIILLCGKPGSGKSYLAHIISARYSMHILSCDKVMLERYGEIEDKAIFQEKLSLTKEEQHREAMGYLDIGEGVILDYGFWTKKERDMVRKMFSRYHTITIYLDIDDSTILSNLAKRNSSLQPHEYYIDKDTFYTLTANFEKPSKSEECIIYNGNDRDICTKLDSIIQRKID